MPIGPPKTFIELDEILGSYPGERITPALGNRSENEYEIAEKSIELKITSNNEESAVKTMYLAMVRGYLNYGDGPVFWVVPLEMASNHKTKQITLYARLYREGST